VILSFSDFSPEQDNRLNTIVNKNSCFIFLMIAPVKMGVFTNLAKRNAFFDENVRSEHTFLRFDNSYTT
jgi:hypothetical protein